MTEEKKYKLEQVSVRLKLCEEPPLYSTEAINSPRSAVNVMKDMLRELDREYVCIVNLDNGGRPINFNVVSIGSINSAPVTMRELFKSAILTNASALLLLHNHPGYRTEKPKPSREDDFTTLRVMVAAEFMSIPLRDHVIVAGGTGTCYSYRHEYGDKFNPAEFGKLIGINEIEGMLNEPSSEYQDFGPKRVMEPGNEDKSDQPQTPDDYKPLAKVEELEEQNYNQIDNVLNNTKSKSRRRREERPSVREKIRERKADMETKAQENKIKDPPLKTEMVV